MLDGKNDCKQKPVVLNHRQAIRLTWGHLSAQTDVALAFVLGNTTLKNQEILEN